MFLEESKWIQKVIAKVGKIENVLDIGSSDIEYRECKQPYISELYANLPVNVDTLDFKAGDGVDYILDITEEGCTNCLKKYDVILVCNILEHIDLSKLDNVIGNIYDLIKDNGYCIATVPFNIGLHPSPIDNGLRPTHKELEDIFSKRFVKVSCEKIVCSHYREPYISNPNLLPLPEVTCGLFRKV